MTTTRGGAERVELHRGRDKLWYFRRVAANNEIVADSEGYQNRADAVKIAHKIYPDVAVWINQGGVWLSDMSENGDHEDETELEGQTVTEGEEVEGEPEFLPEPEQEDAPADAEEGPEPDEPPVEGDDDDA